MCWIGGKNWLVFYLLNSYFISLKHLWYISLMILSILIAANIYFFKLTKVGIQFIFHAFECNESSFEEHEKLSNLKQHLTWFYWTITTENELENPDQIREIPCA